MLWDVFQNYYYYYFSYINCSVLNANLFSQQTSTQIKRKFCRRHFPKQKKTVKSVQGHTLWKKKQCKMDQTEKNHWSQNLTHTQLELIAMIFGFSLRNDLWRRTLAGRSVVGQHVTFGHWHATSRCSSLPEPAAPSCCRDINRWSWTLRDRFGCGFSCVCLYERHTTSHERHAKQSRRSRLGWLHDAPRAWRVC